MTAVSEAAASLDLAGRAEAAGAAEGTTGTTAGAGLVGRGREELGARTWQGRAAAELRATGTPRMGRGRARTALTLQESEVARPAAPGPSHPQIVSRLFLSPRTVSSHLYGVFRTLGITSRAELRDALKTLETRETRETRETIAAGDALEAGDALASPQPEAPPPAPPKQ
ncbi:MULTISPECIES: helix-turn-helix transcriptional regulator [Streptomyces]|uniref:helix-turn-helix transcriptional regulator n=1 Tax=Streptomyces TaxID=1883 RepID=UPI0029AC1BA4|nr:MULTISPECIES: helix-turn-helix transcriptional regulator [unclassified Streptomyces]MDX3091911.1 helix-turn-helix transcriptional regulator [Streptomyces sp. ME12-02E]MDX3330289.1 helix-turn-helix transcriptional regulator [Streptomyces sp. ME02-6978a]